MMSIAVSLIIVAGMLIMLGAAGVNLYLFVKGFRHVGRTARHLSRRKYEEEKHQRPRRDHISRRRSHAYIILAKKAATSRPAVSTAQINPSDPIVLPASPLTAQPAYTAHEGPVQQESAEQEVAEAQQEVADASAPAPTNPDNLWVHGLF